MNMAPHANVNPGNNQAELEELEFKAGINSSQNSFGNEQVPDQLRNIMAD
jgi:hypothetical protein